MMNNLQRTREYISDHRKPFWIGVGIVATVIILTWLLIWNIRQSIPDIVYQPVKACDLLTVSRAQSLLGTDVINVEANKPVVSGDTATSKCGFSDTNPKAMKVAAVAVRTGINDSGTEQNKAEFKEKMATDHGQAVEGYGDAAYFDQTSGKLNVLKGHSWVILSYGIGSTPESNQLSDAKKLANLVLK